MLMQLSVMTGLRRSSIILPRISWEFPGDFALAPLFLLPQRLRRARGSRTPVMAGASGGPAGGPAGAPAGSEMVKLNVYSLSGGQPFAPRRSYSYSELLQYLEHCFMVHCKHWIYWK